MKKRDSHFWLFGLNPRNMPVQWTLVNEWSLTACLINLGAIRVPRRTSLKCNRDSNNY